MMVSIKSFSAIACEEYENLSSSDVSKKLEQKTKLVETLGAKLSEFQKKQVPESDPEHEKVAVKLGTRLGEIYEMCTCVELLSNHTDCKLIKLELEKTLGFN